MNHDQDQDWFVISRWRTFEGELRANVVRVLAIAVLFSVQLLHYHTQVDPESEGAAAATRFHQAAIALAVAGSMFSLTVLMLLQRRFFPPALKYVSSCADVVLIASMAVMGAGPASPIVNAFYVAIALAGLRFNLKLVWCVTIASMCGYLFLVGAKDDVWFDAKHVVAPVEQMVVLVCLALTGIVVGQFIRHVRRIADSYAERLQIGKAEPE